MRRARTTSAPPLAPEEDVPARRPGAARQALVLAAAVVGAALTVAAFYPGYMSTDSIAQLGDARSGAFDAWHPPVLAWVWRQLDRLVPGPAGMLILQNALLWGGLALAVAASVRSRLAPLLVLAVGLSPPVFALAGTVWKDVQMGGALALAVGLVLRGRAARSPVALLAALVPLAYASTLRYNAWTAVLPLAVWWSVEALRVWRPRVRRRWGVVVGVALTVALQASASAATRAVLAGRPTYPLQECFVHDLVAISMVSGREEVPAWAYEGTGTAPLRYQQRRYSPAAADTIVYWQYGYRHFTDPGKIRDLRARWLDAVRRHPGTWLRHRWGLFSRLIGIEDSHLVYWDGIAPNPFGIVHPRHPLNALAMRYVRASSDTDLFRGWVWCVAGLALLGWAAIRGRSTLGTWSLAASATLYLLPFFQAAPSDDFRYVWWVVLAALLSPFTLRRPAPDRSSSATSGLAAARGGGAVARRVAVFTGHFLPHVGGVEIYSHQLWGRLAQRGWEVRLVTSDAGGGPAAELVNGIAVRRLPALKLFDQRFPIVFPSAALRDALAELERFQPSLVVTNLRWMPLCWIALAWARRRGIPVLHVEHGSSHVPMASALGNAASVLLDRTMGRLVARRATRCVGVSSASAAFAATLGARSPGILPMGVAPFPPDPSARPSWRARLGLEERDRAVLFLGRVTADKGALVLLDAWARLDVPGAHLVVVGQGGALDEVRRRAAGLARVHVAGAVAPPEVPRVMAACDLFVHPSLASEGRPVTVLEAAVAGLPLVSTPQGVAGDLVASEGEGTLVAAGDPAALAAAIRRALADAPGSAARAEALRRKVLERFGWDQVIELAERELAATIAHGRGVAEARPGPEACA